MNLLKRPIMQTAKTTTMIPSAILTSVPKADAPSKPTDKNPRPLQTQAGPRAVRFELDISHAWKVSVAGTFNNWDLADAPLVYIGNNRWFKDLYLAPGRYEYRFVMDGKWIDPPKAKAYVLNPYGGRNGVVEV